MHCPKPKKIYISNIFFIDNGKICEVRVLSIISCSGTCFEIGGKHNFWAWLWLCSMVNVMVMLCSILQGWYFNPHFFLVYFGQSLKPKRAWIQVLCGAFMADCLKLWILLIFIVFSFLLFWMENFLRPLQVMMFWMISTIVEKSKNTQEN